MLQIYNSELIFKTKLNYAIKKISFFLRVVTSNQLLIFSGCKFTFGDKGEGRPIPVQSDRSLPETAARLSLQETSHLERGENGMLQDLHLYYLFRFNPFYFSYSDIIFFRKYRFHSWFYVCCTFFIFLNLVLEYQV